MSKSLFPGGPEINPSACGTRKYNLYCNKKKSLVEISRHQGNIAGKAYTIIAPAPSHSLPEGQIPVCALQTIISQGIGGVYLGRCQYLDNNDQVVAQCPNAETTE